MRLLVGVGLLLVVAFGLWYFTQPALSPQQQAFLFTWMECEECNEGDLDSVVNIGSAAVPQLGSFLLQGPPSERDSAYYYYLAALHRRVTEYARTHPDIGTVRDSATYVASYLANYDATYRSRSAVALGMIGGQPARLTLDSALTLPVRPDVHDRIQYAIDSLWNP